MQQSCLLDFGPTEWEGGTHANPKQTDKHYDDDTAAVCIEGGNQPEIELNDASIKSQLSHSLGIETFSTKIGLSIVAVTGCSFSTSCRNSDVTCWRSCASRSKTAASPFHGRWARLIIRRVSCWSRR